MNKQMNLEPSRVTWSPPQSRAHIPSRVWENDSASFVPQPAENHISQHKPMLKQKTTWLLKRRIYNQTTT